MASRLPRVLRPSNQQVTDWIGPVTSRGRAGTSRERARARIAAMTASTATAYERFVPYRRSFEIGFWLIFLLVNATANSVTVSMDVVRVGLATRIAPWEPWVWETSSGLLWAALIPAIVAFSHRFPLHWDGWRRVLWWHIIASIVVCLIHVVGMVGLRKLAYAAMGSSYDFGDWGAELVYEYLKDARSYAGLLLVIEFYRLLLRRWQGEARLLDVPDEGPPLEPIERPERFLVRKLGREFLLAARDIEWLQASGNYVNLRVRGHYYPLRSTVASIAEKLDTARYARIHRSFLVNLDQVEAIEPLDSGDARVHMRDGTTLPCSRTYREALRQRLA